VVICAAKYLKLRHPTGLLTGDSFSKRSVVTVILAIVLLTRSTRFLLRSESHDCGHFVARTTVNYRYPSAIDCIQNRPCASLSESEL